MNYAIIGFGAIGKALAQRFARAGIEVVVTSTHAPEAIAAEARAIGPTVTARPLADAIQADVILLAVPFRAHRDVGRAAHDWRGKTIVDVTNAYGVPPDELGGRPSGAVVADAFPGAKLVKAFNHLPARLLAEDPVVKGGRRVVFLSSDDEAAAATVKELAERLGFAPVSLGKLAEGGQLVHGRGATWGPLIFQDLVKLG